MIRTFFADREGRGDEARAHLAAREGLWPRDAVKQALKRRYRNVEDLGDEQGFALYGVVENDLRFVVALVLAEGASDLVTEVGFLARFTGFDVSASSIEEINRNLHLSVVATGPDGDLYLMGGVAASGEFAEASFLNVLEVWRRDLAMVVLGVSGGGSFVEAFPAAKFSAARTFAQNSAPDSAVAGEPGGRCDPGEMLSKFLGAPKASFGACPSCAGRGRTGLIARTCAVCDGVGIARKR